MALSNNFPLRIALHIWPALLNIIVLFLVVFTLVYPTPLFGRTAAYLRVIDNGPVPRTNVTHRAEIIYGTFG
jgi:hypothetical protein